MADTQTNPITHHFLTLMPATSPGDRLAGWVQLKNGNQDAGYIYISDEPKRPRLGSTRYIVTSVAIDRYAELLAILRSERPLQIRYHDNGAPNAIPSVFIESASLEAGEGLFSSLPDDVAAELASLNS